ncbi:CpsD/CapB family tyrosine-protein kinase [Methylophaga nitratireducenticrescens]|uniref:Tyrosine-protein kinase EpsD n=1 Tax=Methylophaga nitratireducenticrescens TaxID=754476 RepID=I1XIP0_METNJ|nr:CpsD/CapB family tyrosine-protein kinase [Methylophaga nitratireducenticrescens]AFI84259.1 hypothetical protein Q7A_1429 [Methylophaga nitratireducenticrescens]AUZ84337.1 hypothetical protein CDW43_06970 [Methylophaga nitratireducenticrescens]
MKLSRTESTFQKMTIRLLSRLEKSAVPSQHGKVVYVTSAGDQEGKSFISASLASHAASITDNRVLLIDANMESPTLHHFFDANEEAGLSDVLIDKEWQSIPYQTTDLDNLFLLSGGGQRRPGLLFKQHVMDAFLNTVKSQYDLIIVDSASIIRSGANSLANLADGIVIVIDASATRKQVLDFALGELNVSEDKILGAVLNKKLRYIPRFIYDRA